MEYVEVPYTAYLPQTLALLKDPGLLLVAAGVDGQPNPMTIGWGMIGPIWDRTIFAVLVRPSRYTYKLLEESDCFTVCVPAPAMRRAVAVCGVKSGRDVDKFAGCDLKPLPSTWITTPGIAGCPVIYECQIVHTNDIDPACLIAEIQSDFYPREDLHRVYYGEILATRAMPNAAEILAGG